MPGIAGNSLKTMSLCLYVDQLIDDGDYVRDNIS